MKLGSMDPDEKRIEYYLDELERALEIVRSIDEDGWRFYSTQGSEEMREITAQHRAEQVRSQARPARQALAPRVEERLDRRKDRRVVDVDHDERVLLESPDLDPRLPDL